MDYYGYGYGYGDYADFIDVMSEVGIALFGVLLVFLIFLLILSVVFYIFSCLGMYTIAKRRGIRGAWLAWVPLGSNWILGCISDQYQYVTKGKVKNKRKVLLILSIATLVLSTVLQIVSYVMTMSLFMEASQDSAIVFTAINLASSLVCWGLSLSIMIVHYFALYDLYVSCNPANGTLYTVLSIIFSVTEPFFIFACRNKDGGMPPRRSIPNMYV